MTGAIIILCVGLVVVAATGLVMMLAELREVERTMSGDWCRVCQRDLERGKVYEVRTAHEAADDGQGGTFLSATYCRKHAPSDAIRH